MIEIIFKINFLLDLVFTASNSFVCQKDCKLQVNFQDTYGTEGSVKKIEKNVILLETSLMLYLNIVFLKITKHPKV